MKKQIISVEGIDNSGKSLIIKKVKKLFADKAVEFIKEFQNNLKKVKQSDVDKAILKND